MRRDEQAQTLKHYSIKRGKMRGRRASPGHHRLYRRCIAITVSHLNPFVCKYLTSKCRVTKFVIPESANQNFESGDASSHDPSIRVAIGKTRGSHQGQRGDFGEKMALVAGIHQAKRGSNCKTLPNPGARGEAAKEGVGANSAIQLAHVKRINLPQMICIG